MSSFLILVISFLSRLKIMQGFFKSLENILKLDHGDNCWTLWIYEKSIHLETLKKLKT